MTSVIDYNEIKEEIVVYLRNSDIYTTTQRSVTTIIEPPIVLSGNSSYSISRTNVKNIRSISIGATPLVFGTDYTVDYNFLDTTIKTKISFTSSQTGSMTLTYDYGTDIMFPDFPRGDLNISSFPRLAIDIIGDDSVENELGGSTKNTTLTFSVYVYDEKTRDIDATLKAVRTALITQQKDFYYLRYIRRVATGPLLFFGNPKNNIKQRNIDYVSPYNIEIA